MRRVRIAIKQISTLDDLMTCIMPKYKIFPDFIGLICGMDTMESSTTATIIPGSSGGMVVNKNGELVGVASATNGFFGYVVRLKDIQKFLAYNTN